jgi:NADH-quinone oxidoreductase subunit F
VKKVDRIKNPEALEKLRESISRCRGHQKKTIRVCNTGCRARGSSMVLEALNHQITVRGLNDSVEIKKTGCHGLCEMGPLMVIEPSNLFYRTVRPDDVPEIVSETLIDGREIERLLWSENTSKKRLSFERDIPFYQKQKKNVLCHTGRIDPTKIDDYIAEGGYTALGKTLMAMTPLEIIRTIEDSGLRGRGGGGFPAGLKWRSCREAEGVVKYVIANGDEGDPGAFMDRSLMEGDPHSIIEGMIIGAYAIAAHQGYIYVRDEYPIAVEHLSIAIQQAGQYGFLGEDILGTGFDFEVQIKRGAGAFVCGESTALMNSLEGKIGEPRAKLIHTVESGLWERPSNLNNVETWANVPLIINEGAEWYTSLGTDGSKGTKIFSLVGKVNNTGLVEVPMGITLREIIFDIGGGIKGNKAFKAVQTGGPSGGCLPSSKLDMPVDFDRLTEAGSMMGSGGMIVMDENSCVVDLARYFVHFLLDECCGKCVPCREGLRQMHEILLNICEGRGQEGDIELLTELSSFMAQASLCALGRTASNPVLSTIRYFRDEYDAHIFDKRCPAGVCKALIEYYIDAELCTGCTLCQLKCPENAISGKKKGPHMIDHERCIRCGICSSVCKFEAVRVK